METNNITQPDNSPQVVTQIPVSPTPPRKKWVIPLILGGVVILILIVLGAYYLGTSGSKRSSDTESLVPRTPQLTTRPALSPTINLTSDIPSDWTMKEGDCNVKIPLPPKKAPYYIPADPNTPPAVDDEGGWWHFEEHSLADQNDKYFTQESIAVFKNPEALGSGYVAGLVQVICGPNDKNLTTQAYIDDYKVQFEGENAEELTFTVDRQLNLWDQAVSQVTMTGGMFNENDKEYFFASPTHLYRIRIISMSQNASVRDATVLIFNNLQFPK